jgi:hypothetical protein
MAHKILIKQNPSVPFRVLDGECFIYSSFDDRFHHLNETAALIWESCAKWISIESILLAIYRDYKIERSKLKKDVESFIEEMSNTKLLFIK